jgi:transposase-like protein/IS1 family transposase
MIQNACQHDQVKKHGRDSRGNQRYKCLLCGKTFSEPKAKLIGDSRLPIDRAVMCLRLLLEGTSIRATARLTGTDKNAIIDLAVLIGERCERFMRNTHRNVPVEDVQCDEIWGFVGCKERVRARLDKSEEFGDCYCFTAIERTTKLLITWHAGKRSAEDTYQFIDKLNAATGGDYQVSTDGWKPYRTAIPAILGRRVDFAQVIKNYTTIGGDDQRRYSPPTVSSCEKKAVMGDPDMDAVCTSHVERCNLSMRMGMRRLTRLTNGHSKKWGNHEAALALWFAYYNYCRKHETLRTTPAVAAGLTDHVWTVVELLEAIATH